MSTHVFEPRAKMLAALFVIVATLFIDSGWEVGGLVLVFLIAFSVSRIPWSRIARNLFLVSWLALFTLGAHLLGAASASQPFHASMQSGGISAIRLLLIVGWGTILSYSSSPLSLVTGLERLLTPLSRRGVPVQSLSVVAMLSVRFLPILRHEQQMLVRTHIARGIDVTNEPLGTRIKLYVLMCIPLLTHLFRRVDLLSTAMESRAFQRHAVRTVLEHTHLRMVDYALIAGSMLVLCWCVAL
jgi:energy-coupling factor transport system permease protein